MRRKIEENKKIEEDLKSGKKVGVKDRLKFWFRTNVEGIKHAQNAMKLIIMERIVPIHATIALIMKNQDFVILMVSAIIKQDCVSIQQ